MTNVYPIAFPRANGIQMSVNGQLVEVLKTNVAYFVPVACDGAVEVEIILAKPVGDVNISPLRLHIPYVVEGNRVSFSLEAVRHLYLTFGGLDLPVFFYGNQVEQYDGKATYYFKGGQVYEMGQIELKEGESIYIERGAVVRGNIYAKGANNIKIYGQGVLDVSYSKAVGRSVRSVYLVDCHQVEIKDIIIIEPTSWMVVLAGCTHVHIDGIKEIGEKMCSDGIDVVGSNNVLIENCILRNNDDCIVIKCKALERDDPAYASYLKPVFGVEAKNCVLFNSSAGNGLEVGYELQQDETKDIYFHDIDIVRVDGHGAPFSIHAGDQSTVSDVRFENIWVEHYFDKLVDFRIIKARYNPGDVRGQIRNITFENIYVTKIAPNYGCSISIIGGYDDQHTVEGVHFKNFYINGEKAMDIHKLEVYLRAASDITFE